MAKAFELNLGEVIFVHRRRVGKLPEEVSLLGFGCMRLPTLAEGGIDEEQAIKIIRYAVDHGVNYLDTAYGYHQGKSEVLVGKAMQNGYRNKVNVATKLPVWLLNSSEDCGRLFNEQLERLGVDQIDFYLLHALNRDNWHRSRKFKALEFLSEAKATGRIRYAGFSFHDDVAVFKKIVDSYPWDFCQIQFNYMDENYQAGLEGLKYAADHGLGVMIMEPLRGGRLVRNVPEEIQDLFSKAPQKRTPAEWAFRWVANHPEVSLILSGMGNLAEVQENIRIMGEATPQSLTADELKIVEQAQKFYQQRVKILCTDCKYCLPCPQGVAIPQIFSIYNNASIYDSFKSDQWQYEELQKKAQDGAQCIACGQCESVCPQNLRIIETLQMAHRAFE